MWGTSRHCAANHVAILSPGTSSQSEQMVNLASSDMGSPWTLLSYVEKYLPSEGYRSLEETVMGVCFVVVCLKPHSSRENNGRKTHV